MLKLQQISFCNKIAKNVIDNNDKQIFINKLYNNYQISINDKDYIILNKDYITNLVKNTHYLSLFSNGNQYFLYLTMNNNCPICLFIDRKIKSGYKYPRVLLVNFDFDLELFENDTLFGGELVKTINSEWIFILNNLYVHNGQKCKQMNIISKFNLIYKILGEKYRYQSNQPCSLKVKKIFCCNQINDILKDIIPNLNYNFRGFIFFPENYKYSNILFIQPNENNITTNDNSINIPKLENKIVNKDNRVLKTIPTNNNIISEIDNLFKINDNNNIYRFEIRETENSDIYEIYSKFNNQHIYYGLCHISSLKCSKFISRTFDNNKNKSIILNCKYCKKFGKWEPLIESNIESEVDSIEKIMSDFQN